MCFGLHIRPATFDDIEAVVALDRATAELPHWAADQYAAAVQPVGCLPPSSGVYRNLFLAESAGILVGFSVAKIARFESDSIAEFESIAVAASSRRSGIGKALCTEAIEWARTQGAQTMDLEVRSRNDAAISLYAGLGFVAEGTRPLYYREPPDDALLMRLDLL